MTAGRPALPYMAIFGLAFLACILVTCALVIA